MSHTALVVEIPEAENMVGDIRADFDSVSLLGMPAHITILYPFVRTSEINREVLDKIANAIKKSQKFAFTLGEVGEFAETVFLAPTPSDRLIQLIKSVVTSFPEYPPFGGAHDTIIPHLSVLNGHKAFIPKVKAKLHRRLVACGEISVSCSEVSLFSFEEGQWQRLHVFDLA